MNVLSIGANRLLIVALNVGKEIDRQCLSDQRICYNRYTNTWLTITSFLINICYAYKEAACLNLPMNPLIQPVKPIPAYKH